MRFTETIQQQPMSALARSYKMEIIIDEKTGLEIVYIVNEDGTTLSMFKSVWDELEAQKELGGTL